MTRNIVEENSSLSMTNPDTNYPVENIHSNILEEIAQASSSSTIITVSFDEDKSANSVFFGYHNVSNAIFVFKDSGGVTLDTVSFSFPNENAKKYFTELDNIRIIEATLITSESIVYIGGIDCGMYTEIYNVMLPISVEHMDSSLYSQTSGGHFLYRAGFVLQSFAVECHKISDTELEEFQSAWAYVHKGKTFWMDRTEEQEKQIFGAFDSNYVTTRIDELSELKFSFKEAK